MLSHIRNDSELSYQKKQCIVFYKKMGLLCLRNTGPFFITKINEPSINQLILRTFI
jgi:hypothetical protein